ncbi:MAG: hypothetical protein AAGA99_10920 [Actinomycetota bacterium]
MLDVFLTLVVSIVVLIPVAIVVAALLDAASRPDWVWALAGRTKPMWMGVIIVSGLFVVPGLVVAAIYGTKVRPQLQAIERGDLGSG